MSPYRESERTSAPRRHELKTWPEPFAAIQDGRKRHEIRTNDRGFNVGDVIVLQEYDPDVHAYSGAHITVRVTYMTPGGAWGLPEHLCVMSIVQIDDDPSRESGIS